jgi:hypothetical protein
LPKSVEEALEINRTTNTDLWRKAINKEEMSRVKVAWKTKDEHTPQEVRDGKVPELTDFKKLDVTLYSILRWTSHGKHGLLLVVILWRPLH